MTIFTPQQQLSPAANGHAAAAEPASAHEIKYRQDAANYVAAMVAELRQLSGKAGFEKLVAALDAAYYEAYSLMGARPAAPSADQPEKISDRMEPNGS